MVSKMCDLHGLESVFFFFENMGCGSTIQANLIAFALHHVSLRNQSYSYAQSPEQRLLTSYVLYTDVHFAVHKSTSCRPQIFIFPSFNAQ